MPGACGDGSTAMMIVMTMGIVMIIRMVITMGRMILITPGLNIAVRAYGEKGQEAPRAGSRGAGRKTIALYMTRPQPFIMLISSTAMEPRLRK